MAEKVIHIVRAAGTFAENKDVARDLRIKQMTPALKKRMEVILDFEGVEGATQSFVHALISEPIREFGPEVIDHILFRHCNQTIQRIVSIVVDYMQES